MAAAFAAQVLALWERGFGLARGARGDALLDGAPAQTLGECNAALVALHARLFGRALALVSECPACGIAVQFDVDCAALAAGMACASAATHRFEHGSLRVEFRLPAPHDLDALQACDDEDDFALKLLERCVIDCSRFDAALNVRALDEQSLDAISQRMQALDPAASVAFAAECPACAARWDAACDVGEVVWQKIAAAAERTLLDIDTLARAYGWTEGEVLALTPLRRAAYLQLAA